MLFTLAAGSEPGSTGTTNTENTLDFGLRSCPTIALAPECACSNATHYAAYSQTPTGQWRHRPRIDGASQAVPCLRDSH